MGTAQTTAEIDWLLNAARKFIDSQRIKSGVISFFDTRFEQSELEKLLESISFVAVLDTVTYRFLQYFYQIIGFGRIRNDCFKDLVIARIVEPVSKRQTKDLLEVRFDRKYPLNKIYQTLRSVSDNNYQDKIEQIVYRFVKNHISRNINVLFFDVTTLYFEAFDEDDFRRYGFSKDNKHNQPQIVIGLTVTTDGIPLSVSIFEGSKFEGHTIIPAMSALTNRLRLDEDFVVVADSAMLSQKNIGLLEDKKLKYIVGARLGSLSRKLFREVITSMKKIDGETVRINLNQERTLIVSYSEKRAGKDRHDREKQIKKAKYLITNPSGFMNRYKFLTSKDKKGFCLNEEIIEKARQLEGLKGYITNAAKLPSDEIIKRYSELWQVEKAFRMSKSDLKARPIFHTLKQSIEAHILIVFTALTISRYIEFTTKTSIHTVVKTLSRIKEIVAEDNVSGQRARKLTNLTTEAKQLLEYTKINWVI